MTSEKNAIFQKSMILSPTDEKLNALKYKPGDRFVQRNEALKYNGYDEEMRDALGQNLVIIEVDSFEVNHIGDVGYRFHFVEPEQDWRWFLTEEVLEEDFVFLKTPADARFYALGE